MARFCCACVAPDDLRGQDEVDRHESRALVQQLIKRVLRVVAGLAPDDHARVAAHGLAVHAHALAARFHLQLLQVRREALEAIVVGQNRLGFGAEEIVVPDAQQREQHGHVLFKRRLPEMQVHATSAREDTLEHVHADDERERQPNRRPQRVTTTDPVPEAEAEVGTNTEIVHGFVIRGCGNEVILHRDFVELLNDPLTRRFRVGHRLERRKGLRTNNEQRRFSIKLALQIGKLRAVDVGHAVKAHAVTPVGLQCAARHDRPKIRAADADVHDVGQALSRTALDLAAMHIIDKRLHAREHFPDLGHAGRFQRNRVGNFRPQRTVQYGAILGLVNALTREHGLDRRGHGGLLRELHQQFARSRVEVILGIVEKKVVRFESKPRDALFVAREQLAQRTVTHILAIMRRQALPGGKISGVTGGEFSIGVGVGHAVRSYAVLLRSSL